MAVLGELDGLLVPNHPNAVAETGGAHACGHNGQLAAIDIETGAFEVDESEIAAGNRLRARLPNAQTWMSRIGSRYLRRFGFVSRKGGS